MKYAWKWKTKRIKRELPKEAIVEVHDFVMLWNDLARVDKAIHPEGADQSGCIHTVHGLEIEYVGVINGNDLIFNMETQSIKVKRENFKDKGARPAKYEIDWLDKLLRNTYKTLMT